MKSIYLHSNKKTAQKEEMDGVSIKLETQETYQSTAMNTPYLDSNSNKCFKNKRIMKI